MIKDFEEYLNEGIIIKISIDKQRAYNLILESERKYSILSEMINNLGIDDKKANDYIEFCYNILLFLIRSKMFLEGYYSSGKGAHEAEIAFIKEKGFSDYDLNFLDQLRYFRNGILYYGKRFDAEYAKKVIKFTKKNYLKLRKMILKNNADFINKK
jgi:hypothetical protein